MIEVIFCEIAAKRRKRTQLQTTQKFGCHASVTIRRVVRYPQHKVTSGSGLSANGLKEAKKHCLAVLQEEVERGAATSEDRFYVMLPCEEAHSGHSLTEAGGMCQRVHPAVVAQIHHLVAQQVTDTRQIIRLLRSFVNEQLLANCEAKPGWLNRSFFPSAEDVRFHIYSAKMKQQLSKVDQEEVIHLATRWQNERPASQYYFRPFVPSSHAQPDNEGDIPPSGEAGGSSDVLSGNSADGETTGIESEGGHSTLLWVRSGNLIIRSRFTILI